MKKDKDNAVLDFYDMIQKSWTYARLTENERKRLAKAFSDVDCQRMVSGSYTQRWMQCQAIYRAFLLALDYKPLGWREPENSEAPLF